MAEDKSDNLPDIGMVMTEVHFPGKAPIEAYGNGGFRFADMSHRGSLIFLPSGIYAWNVTEPEHINLQSLEKVLEESEGIEVLLVGTGDDLRPLSKEIRQQMREKGISADAMNTGAAVRTYNVLLAENRAVAAAILAIDL